MQTLHIETCMSMTFPKNILWMVSDRLVDYRIRVLAAPPLGIKRDSDGFFCSLGQKRKISWTQQKISDGYIPFNSERGGSNYTNTVIHMISHQLTQRNNFGTTLRLVWDHFWTSPESSKNTSCIIS